MKAIIQLCFMALAILLLSTAAVYGQGYKVGDYATDFSLRNIDGEKVSLAQYKDAKGAIVIFTCNTCPYAKMYEDRIIALHQQYAAKGYPVIAINPNDPEREPGDSFEQMQARAKEKNYPFPYLQDETQQITTAYGATRTPEVYLLKKDNKGYRVEYIGAIDNNHKDAAKADKKYVEDAINGLIAGKKPTTNFTKAIGCTIKWKESK
ncbi:thioredoxin family protein [Nafulsella turpanensis]|uniref:thioredoxin family protein n=1 Tax=Nafulsella turpanensis TaxID=1265690 RepID=UPI00035CAF20|nr:thioredoxin family protein [Nafulsella turpanensis]